MTVGELIEAYEVCISSLRKSQGARRTMSLKKIAPANFSKEVGLMDFVFLESGYEVLLVILFLAPFNML